MKVGYVSDIHEIMVWYHMTIVNGFIIVLL